MSRDSASALLLKEALAPLSFLYGGVMRARAEMYRRGVLSSERIEGAAVISVGNLTTGGTGKTPLVKFVARLCAEIAADARGAATPSSICILSRGYGRRDPHHRVVVSDGQSLLADAAAGGDEPRELAEELIGVAAVISDTDRIAAAHWAQANLGSRVFILDDGFQHERIKRDLNIVTIDATDPWGGGRLLPRGRLREPPSALRRADCIVLTRCEQIMDASEIERTAAKLSGGKKVIRSRTRIRGVLPLGKQSGIKSETDVRAGSALAFCALGNPESFFTLLRLEGWKLVQEIAFRDHHRYMPQDVSRIEQAARQSGAEVLLTTAKDEVKLRDLQWSLPCRVVEIDFVIDDEAEFAHLIRNTLAHIKS